MATRKFTAGWIRKAPPGKHYAAAGHGLLLRVRPSGRARWCWRGTVRGKRVELGLGRRAYRTLQEARETAFEYARIAARGGDPRSERSSAPTFEQAADAVIQIQRQSWRGTVSEHQWRQHFADYVFPLIGSLTVDEVTAADVLPVVTPIWMSNPR